MNHVVEHTPSGSVAARDLVPWFLGRGIVLFTTEDAAHLLGVPQGQVRQRLAALRKRSEVASCGRGLWLAVADNRRLWGAPEPIAYIDALMEAYGADYCVGWLSSAAVHGASHQAAQVFQVATSRPLADRILGRSRLRFYTAENVRSYAAPLMTFSEGRARVAGVETTMLMLAANPERAAGIDNSATAIAELAEEISFSAAVLAGEAELFPAAAARRVGWMLEKFAEIDTSGLDEFARCAAGLAPSPSYLSPTGGKAGRLNKRWNVIENRKVEPDL